MALPQILQEFEDKWNSSGPRLGAQEARESVRCFRCAEDLHPKRTVASTCASKCLACLPCEKEMFAIPGGFRGSECACGETFKRSEQGAEEIARRMKTVKLCTHCQETMPHEHECAIRTFYCGSKATFGSKQPQDWICEQRHTAKDLRRCPVRRAEMAQTALHLASRIAAFLLKCKSKNQTPGFAIIVCGNQPRRMKRAITAAIRLDRQIKAPEHSVLLIYPDIYSSEEEREGVFYDKRCSTFVLDKWRARCFNLRSVLDHLVDIEWIDSVESVLHAIAGALNFTVSEMKDAVASELPHWPRPEEIAQSDAFLVLGLGSETQESLPDDSEEEDFLAQAEEFDDEEQN